MNLIGLRQSYVVLSDGEQRELVGCGSGTFNDPYTKEEFWGMMADLNHPWTGGYVMGMGYFMPEWTLIIAAPITAVPQTTMSYPFSMTHLQSIVIFMEHLREH